MTIAVTTPTGNVVRHLVDLLIRGGVRPRVLVRDPDRLRPEVRAAVDAVPVDQLDRDSVIAATRDVDALFWVDPPSSASDPLADYARATDAVAAAVTANRIDRVVFQSSVGAELRHGAGEIDGLARTELALDATSASVLHLRCGYFFTNLAMQPESLRTGVLQVLVPVDAPMPWVAPRDIAEMAGTRLLSTAWSGRVVQAVHGPADLSWSNVASILSDAIGLPLRAERVSDDVQRRQLRDVGMNDTQIASLLGMSIGLREGFVPEQPRTPATTTPTPLAAWAFTELRPLLAR